MYEDGLARVRIRMKFIRTAGRRQSGEMQLAYNSRGKEEPGAHTRSEFAFARRDANPYHADARQTLQSTRLQMPRLEARPQYSLLVSISIGAARCQKSRTQQKRTKRGTGVFLYSCLFHTTTFHTRWSKGHWGMRRRCQAEATLTSVPPLPWRWSGFCHDVGGLPFLPL